MILFLLSMVSSKNIHYLQKTTPLFEHYHLTRVKVILKNCIHLGEFSTDARIIGWIEGRVVWGRMHISRSSISLNPHT